MVTPLLLDYNPLARVSRSADVPEETVLHLSISVVAPDLPKSVPSQGRR